MGHALIELTGIERVFQLGTAKSMPWPNSIWPSTPASMWR